MLFAYYTKIIIFYAITTIEAEIYEMCCWRRITKNNLSSKDLRIFVSCFWFTEKIGVIKQMKCCLIKKNKTIFNNYYYMNNKKNLLNYVEEK